MLTIKSTGEYIENCICQYIPVSILLTGMKNYIAKLETLCNFFIQLNIFHTWPRKYRIFYLKKSVHRGSSFGALFVIARHWKQCKRLSMNEWINCGTYVQWNTT